MSLTNRANPGGILIHLRGSSRLLVTALRQCGLFSRRSPPSARPCHTDWACPSADIDISQWTTAMGPLPRRASSPTARWLQRSSSRLRVSAVTLTGTADHPHQARPPRPAHTHAHPRRVVLTQRPLPPIPKHNSPPPRAPTAIDTIDLQPRVLNLTQVKGVVGCSDAVTITVIHKGNKLAEGTELPGKKIKLTVIDHSDSAIAAAAADAAAVGGIPEALCPSWVQRYMYGSPNKISFRTKFRTSTWFCTTPCCTPLWRCACYCTPIDACGPGVLAGSRLQAGASSQCAGLHGLPRAGLGNWW